jgi:hypothetical protein
MLMEMLKGVGYALAAMTLLSLWPVPDSIGKIVETWRFFRGDRLD